MIFIRLDSNPRVRQVCIHTRPREYSIILHSWELEIIARSSVQGCLPCTQGKKDQFEQPPVLIFCDMDLKLILCEIDLNINNIRYCKNNHNRIALLEPDRPLSFDKQTKHAGEKKGKNRAGKTNKIKLRSGLRMSQCLRMSACACPSACVTFLLLQRAPEAVTHSPHHRTHPYPHTHPHLLPRRTSSPYFHGFLSSFVISVLVRLTLSLLSLAVSCSHA